MTMVRRLLIAVLSLWIAADQCLGSASRADAWASGLVRLRQTRLF